MSRDLDPGWGLHEPEPVEKRPHCCSECGLSEADGAMFTLDPDSQYCDNCYSAHCDDSFY